MPRVPLSSVSVILFATVTVATWPRVAIAAPHTANGCSALPPPVIKLPLQRFYTDAAGARPDTTIRDRNRAITRPLKDYLNNIARLADRAVLGSDHQAAACAIAALDTWAAASALSGPMPTKQGEHHRKWAMTGLALAYLKLAPYADADHHRRISAWLANMADDAAQLFRSPNVKRNNHYTWLGLGLAAVGLATGSHAHWQRAVEIRDQALGEIAPNGTLPMELARKSKALHYHVFATTPLIILDWLAEQRGRPASAAGQAARNRLVRQTLAGLNDPELFERLTGVRQNLDQQRKWPAGYGWPALLHPAASPPAVPIGHALPRHANGHRWIGGDIRALIVAVRRLQNASNGDGASAADTMPRQAGDGRTIPLQSEREAP